MITSLPTISLNQIGKTKEEYDSGGDNYNIFIYSQFLCDQGDYVLCMAITISKYTHNISDQGDYVLCVREDSKVSHYIINKIQQGEQTR